MLLGRGSSKRIPLSPPLLLESSGSAAAARLPRVHSSGQSSTMQISALSLDSQLAILSQLPSHTLLNAVPLVCTGWNQLQPYACRRRRTVRLTIRPNPQQSAESRHFELRPAPLNTSYAAALFASFPSVTHLIIVHKNIGLEALDPQLNLLQSWIPTLVSLDLFTNADYQALQPYQLSPQFGAFFGRLLALLNQMSRLKQLRLTIVGQLPAAADLSFLGRLVDVDLNTAFSEHILIPQLLQHCSSTLQRCSLSLIRNFPNFQPLLTSSSICSKLECLGTYHFNLDQLAITFDRCSRLRSLYLFLSTLDHPAQLLHLLTKLPSLTELLVNLKQMTTGPLDPVTASAPLPVLPSLRHLAIYLESIPSHEHFVQATQLDHVFPQLQKIWLEWLKEAVCCRQCKDNNRDPNSCSDALLRPLTRLETLQKATVCQVANGTKNVNDWLPRLQGQ